MTDTVLLIGGGLDGKRISVGLMPASIVHLPTAKLSEGGDVYHDRECYRLYHFDFGDGSAFFYAHDRMPVGEAFRRLIARYPDYEVPK